MGAREALSPLSPAAAASGAALLEARDVSVVPPGASQPVVRDLSLTVSPGEWIALIGENGGGKTSLLHALAGLWPISEGSLTLEGRPFGPAAREASAGSVAVVLQDPGSQILQSTVAEELAFTARNLGMPEHEVRREVEHWARALDLETCLGQDPATCSAGQQQRILLGAALAARPRLLLADEPTAHLDPAGRSAVRSIIRSRMDRGLSVIWATQDRDETSIATRAVTLDRGRRDKRASAGPAAAPTVPRPGSWALKLRVSGRPPDRGPRVRVGGPLEVLLGEHGVTAFVGPNGAGKSVLLLAIAGLEPAPQVSVEWKQTHGVPPIMALQYPELQVFEDKVSDELAFAAVSRGLDRSRVMALAANALRELGFDPEDLLRRHTWSLSTGEKRLIEVVGALIAPAGLVLLDEPTAGLDPGRRAALASLVGRRATMGPVLVASQDLEWLNEINAVRVELGA